MPPTDPPAEPNSPELPPKKVKYPPAVRTAGVCWILMSFAQLAGVVVMVVMMNAFPTRPQDSHVPPPKGYGEYTAPRPAASATSTGSSNDAVMFVVLIVGGIISLAFALTGGQALVGGASNFTGAGAASVFLGLLFAGGAVAVIASGANPGPAVGSMGSAFLACLGGAFALSGGKQYTRWRKWQKHKKQLAKLAREADPPAGD